MMITWIARMGTGRFSRGWGCNQYGDWVGMRKIDGIWVGKLKKSWESATSYIGVYKTRSCITFKRDNQSVRTRVWKYFAAALPRDVACYID